VIETVEFESRDGYRLGATFFRPSEPAARAVTIQAATGVRQDYYAKFAAFLAERGVAALIYDYRGIGRSRPTRLRGFRARMRDWALLDAPAALDFLERTAPGARLMAVGHSFGGQTLGLLPDPGRIRAALVVGAQSGYWRNWPALGRSWMWLATHAVLPTAPRLLGYFPSKLLGFGEDLPAGVAIEWASWCRNPRYVVGALGAHEGYARFTSPLRAYAVRDDRLAPVRAVEALLELYPHARSEIRHVAPADVGAARIGHFGFFRERFRDTLWREAADWLTRQ